MARNRQPTLTDYLVIAISPGLVMLLVGSLTFFLLTAFYDGAFPGRLRYIAALFVLACVLICRISVSNGASHAAAFGLPLAAVTWMAWNRFTDAGSLMGVIILGVIWWTAHKLTWDCTVLDEAEEPDNAGLWQAAGLDDLLPSPDRAATTEAARTQDHERLPENAQASAVGDGHKPWWNRWPRGKRGQRTPHAPGVWVIYFLMATLPLFGLGQWTIPAAAAAARREAFLCLAVYLGSGLGLMCTTSFLNLRRYLRQRRLEMPVEMTGIWLGLAAGLIVAVLLVSSLLPRSRPEFTLGRMLGSTSDARADRWHFFRREGAPSSDDAEAVATSAPPGESTSQPATTARPRDAQPDASSTSADSGAATGDSGAATGDPAATAGDQPPGDGAADAGRPAAGSRPDAAGGSESGGTSPSSQPVGGPRSGADPPSSPSGGTSPSSQSGDEPRSGADPPSSPSGGQGAPAGDHAAAPQQAPPPERPRLQAPQIGSLARGLAIFLHWLYWLIVLGIAAYLLWRYGRQLWSALRALFSGLILPRWHRAAQVDSPSADEAPPPPPPFQAFLRRWQQQAQWEDAELVRYSFAALEAWSRERMVARSEGETPWEFGQRLAAAFPALAEESSYLIAHYDRMAYDPAGSGKLQQTRLRRLWQALSAES